MNIHHLELFYYVAKHRGVSAAARHMPYGVQQPAISAQVIQLEDDLGTTLFTRRPFKLTRAGEELFEFIEPFFGGISEIARRLRGGAEVNLRIGTIETVQREYLPQVLSALVQEFPRLHFTLVPANLEAVEAALLAQEIDIGVAPLLGKRPPGISEEVILRVPMTLLVAENSKLSSADDLLRQDRIAEPLITGPDNDAICRCFQNELQRRGVEWFPSIELSSQQLIGCYVAKGFGVGMVLVEPGVAAPAGTRLLPLNDFPSVPYGLLWSGALSPLQKAFCAEAHRLAGQLSLNLSESTRTGKCRPPASRSNARPRAQAKLRAPSK